MLLTDALELTTKPAIDDDGNMLVSARAARTGIQLYRGVEVGKPEMEWVSVYRDPADVFSRDSLESYTAIPVTIEHPRNPVTADNWKDVAVGETDAAIKDGEYIRVPFTVRHAKAVKQIRDGKAEISMGYSANLLWDSGETPDGQKYDAKVTDLRMNHLAIVSRARGGDKLRIGDDAGKPEKETKVPHIMHDGLKIDLTDAEAVSALVTKLTDAEAKAKADLATALTDKATAEAATATAATAHVTAIEAKDAEIATLKAEKATLETQLADASDPVKLRDAAAEYAGTVAKAKSLGATIADNASTADVKRAAVSHKLGDTAKDWTDAQVDVSFATLTAGFKADAAKPDAFRDAMANRKPADFADAAAKSRESRQKMIDGMVNYDPAKAE